MGVQMTEHWEGFTGANLVAYIAVFPSETKWCINSTRIPCHPEPPAEGPLCIMVKYEP